MKKLKRGLILLVAVAMIFSMVPSTSFAWADTENVVDTGEDNSSVFDVSEENETETVEEPALVDEPTVTASAGTITGFQATLMKDGLTNKNGNWTKVMTESAAGQSVQYNVVWTVDVPNDSYAAGELEIRLPRSIFYHYVLNADGTVQMDANNKPVRELDQDEVINKKTQKTYEVAFSGNFPYDIREEGDELVLTNNEVIANTQSIYQFTIEYFMTHESFDYRDYEDHASDMGNTATHTCVDCGSRPMNVTITDKQSDAMYTASADEVYIDTSAKLSSVYKICHGFSDWFLFGEPEENSDQYNYIMYQVKIDLASKPTKYYTLNLKDVLQDKIGNGDVIVAYYRENRTGPNQYSGGAYPPVRLDTPSTTVNIVLDYGNVQYLEYKFLVRTVKPTSAEEYPVNIKETNRATATITPLFPNSGEATTGYYEASFERKLDYSYPTGMFMVRKYGNSNYHKYQSNYTWPVCTYGLTDFQNDPNAELEGFRFLVDFYGNALPYTNSDGQNPLTVGTKPVLWDYSDSNTNVTLEGEHITSEDYYLKELCLQYGSEGGDDTKDEYFDVATASWKSKTKGNDFFANDIITLYVQKGDSAEWIKAGSISVTGSPYAGDYSFTPANPEFIGDITTEKGFRYIKNNTSIKGTTIKFAAKDITGFRITNENKHTYLKMTGVANYVLKHSSRVDRLIEGKDEITFFNQDDLAVYAYDLNNNGTDAYTRVFLYSVDAKPKDQVLREAKDYARGEIRDLKVNKMLVSGENNGPSEKYVTSWRTDAAVDYTGGMTNATGSSSYISYTGYEQQHGGRFYDLLPKGTGVVQDSIKVYKVCDATTNTPDSLLLTKGDDYTVDIQYDTTAKQYMFVVDITSESVEGEVSVKEGPYTFKRHPGYTLFFDTETSWTALDDYGKIITNVVGYKTDGLHPITLGNYANNVSGSDLEDLSDEERFNVDYNYTINKMKSVVDANRGFLAFDFAYASTTAHYNTSSVTGPMKRVQGENDASPSKDTTVAPTDTYRYSLRYQSGAVNRVENIVLYDNIENYGDHQDWRGTFKGVDLSELPEGVTPTVYCTTQDVDFQPYINANNPPINDTSLNWQELTDSTDLSTVRTIAISMGNYVMGSYSSLTVWLNFEAPSENDTDKPLPETKNDDLVSCTQNNHVAVAPGNFVTVRLEVLGEIKIHKVDDLGVPMEGVQFTLKGTDKFGRPVNLEDTTNARGNLTFSDLPISGAEGYTLTEEVPDGYIDEGRTWTVTVNTDGTTEIDGEAVSDAYYEIVNHEETTAEADKTWFNADGTTNPPAGATVVFNLLADGTPTNYTVTLDGTKDNATPESAGGYESEAWKASFVHLPKYKTEGAQTKEIVYTVKESVTYPGYAASTTDGVASGGTISNTQKKTEISVTKAWKNADGTTTAPENAEVEFTLWADGEETDYTITLDGTADTAAPTVTGGYESEAWKATFVNLPKYRNDNGTEAEIVYTVKESGEWAGYEVIYEGGSTVSAIANGVITNSQKTTDISVIKAWEQADGSNEAPQGGSVVFKLYADGTPTNYTVTLDGTADGTAPTVTGGYESEAWKATFVNLPKYKVVDGEEVDIAYTVDESTGWPGYTVIYPNATANIAADGETITNKEEVVSLSVTKAWKNADGTTTVPDGAEVTFTLYADGDPTNFTVTLDGTENSDPIMQGGEESAPWVASFVRLPKYRIDDKEGEAVAIVYTVQESGTWPGYTVSYGDHGETCAVDGGTITNSQETSEISVTKAWEPLNGNIPGGANVIFTLCADGDPTNYKVVLDGRVDTVRPTVTGGYENEAWKATFVNLPKTKLVNGQTQDIQYSVIESGTWPGYTVSYGSNGENCAVNGGVITNTEESTGLSVTKAWKNADGSTTAPQGAKVTFTLYADGDPTEYSVTLEGIDNADSIMQGGQETPAWTASFVRLPKYRLDDKEEEAVEIQYTVVETGTWPGYEVVYEGGETATYAVDGGTITNEQITTEISGIKTWNDEDFFVDGVPVNGYQRPESITINLLADGVKVDEVEVTEDDEWEYEFTDLPKYRIADGQAVEIVYTVEEEVVAGYEGIVTGTDVENTPVSVVDIEPTEIILIKADALTWDESIDPIVPGQNVPDTGMAGAEFTLTAPDGSETTVITGADGTVTILFAAEGWYTLKETKAPDGYENPGKEYRIEIVKSPLNWVEELVDDENAPGGKLWICHYTLDAFAANFSLTNDCMIVQDPPELIEISGEKIWDDENDADKIRPKSIVVELYADGEKVDEQTVTAASNWKFTFTDLPKVKDGEEIVYTIGEVKVEGYTTKIDGFKITNTHTPKIKTGDEMNLGLWIGMLIMALAAMGILGVRRLIKKR